MSVRILRIHIVPVLLLTLITFGSQAQQSPIPGLEDYVRKAMKEWDMPGLALAIVNSNGIVYEKGFGVPKDLGKAVRWYRRAAEQGHSPARKGLERLRERA